LTKKEQTELMTAMMTINQEIVEQKLGVAFGALTGLVTASMIHVGHDLGLYGAMDGRGPLTAAQLAAEGGLQERFVSEWLAQQAAAGILESRGAGQFELSPEAALVFADANNPASQIAIFAFLPAMEELFTSSKLAFRSGLGKTYDAFGEDVARAMDASFGAWNRTALVPDALPKIPGVTEKLRAGAKVADVGCGAGAGPIAVAQAFPAADVHGYDNSSFALQLADQNKASAGVTNVAFHNADVDPLPSTPTFDFVMTLDCLHDMPRPDVCCAAIRQAIKPDGIWFIVDIDGQATTEENLEKNPMAAFFYGGSIALCLQSACSTPDALKLGTFGLPEPKMRELVTAAGFSRFRRVEGLHHPFNAYYEVRP
jgi:2-polyprenyl-3-methyl-5-hydroxy-6-metoxy-1,4-benzoquinol methylase